MKFKLAYIDDLATNCEAINFIFNGEEFETLTYTSPKMFLEELPSNTFDCIITDIHMPEMDGFSFFDKIITHNNFNKCPVFFMSSDDTEMNRIRSYDVGGVDFLNRLVPHQEMISRVRSKIIYHRKNRPTNEMGNAKIDFDLCKFFINNEEVKLTFIEFKLMTFFFRHFPEVTPKNDLIGTIWGDEIQDATVYTHIGNLQHKIEAWDYELITMKGKGFRIKQKNPSEL